LRILRNLLNVLAKRFMVYVFFMRFNHSYFSRGNEEEE
jgi:hypothetical protein